MKKKRGRRGQREVPKEDGKGVKERRGKEG